jgi:hypothetical protein
MAEAEVEHEHAIHAAEGHEIHAPQHGMTRFGKGVAVGVSLLGVVLAVVGIASHRAHTAAVIQRTDANDQWAFYQAKKTREYVADAAASLSQALTSDPARVQGLVEHYGKEKDRYQHDADGIQQLAQDKAKASEHEESRALLLDVSEGFLELGLVLCSLYFLAHRKFFPLLGSVAAIAGAAFGAWAFLT